MKQPEENIIKSIRNCSKLKEENKSIKDRIIKDIRTIFKQENEYFKPARVDSFRQNTEIKLNPT